MIKLSYLFLFAQANRRPDPFEDTANTSKGAEASYSYLRFLINDLVHVFNGGHDVHDDRVDQETDVDHDHDDDVFDDGEDGDANNYGD